MTERFKIKLSHIGELMDCETKTILAISDIAEELIPLCDLLNELYEENQYLKSLKWNQDCINEISINTQQKQLLEKENEELKQQIKDLQIGVLDSIYEANHIECNCNPCVVEEYVKKVLK